MWQFAGHHINVTTIRSVPLERYGVVDCECLTQHFVTNIIGFGGRHAGSNSSIRSNGAGAASQLQCQQKIEFYRSPRCNFITDGWRRAVGRRRGPAEMFLSTFQQHEIVRSLLHTRVSPHPWRFQIHRCDDGLGGTKEVERRTHLRRRNDGVGLAEHDQDVERVREDG